MLVNDPAEYPKPDEDNVVYETLLLDLETHEYALPSIPHPQKAVLFYPLPGQVCHLQW